MTVCILFFILHVIIYGPRVCNKHLNNNTLKCKNTVMLDLSKAMVCKPITRLSTVINNYIIYHNIYLQYRRTIITLGSGACSKLSNSI